VFIFEAVNDSGEFLIHDFSGHYVFGGTANIRDFIIITAIHFDRRSDLRSAGVLFDRVFPKVDRY
jgi:hypothetical protein